MAQTGQAFFFGLRQRLRTFQSAVSMGNAQWPATISVFAFSTFMLLGNALAFGNPTPRRVTQALVLALSLGAYVWFTPLVPRITPFVTLAKTRLFQRGLALLAVPTLFAALVGVFTSGRPTGESLLPLFAVLLWTTLLWAVAATLYLGRGHLREAHPVNGPEVRRPVFTILLFTGLWLVASAWWNGPSPGEAYASFDGSVILTALCGAIGYFIFFFCFSFPIALLVSLPYAYLIIFSTSRTGHMLLLAMLFMFAIVRFCRKPKPVLLSVPRALISFFLPLLVLATVVFFPIHIESRWYPYYTPAEQVEVVPYRVAELYNRISRSFRAINAMGFQADFLTTEMMQVTSGLFQFGNALFPNSDLEKFRNRQGAMTEHLQSIIKQNGDVDDRWTLIERSHMLAAEKVLGHWPVSFASVVDVTCAADGVACAYPHNMLYDVAFHFGWVTAGIFFVGLAVLTLALLWQLSVPSSLMVSVLAVCILNHLLGMQITGTFPDYSVAFVLIVLWLMEMNSNIASHKELKA